jgi:hypothetical protein
MRNKLELTKTILAQIPNGHPYSAEDAMKLWWMNIRSTGGLRLTTIGYQVLLTLDLESWKIDITDPRKINKKVILELDHKLQYPYFLDAKKRQLILFSSREAMMATLYGDLEAWLKNLP